MPLKDSGSTAPEAYLETSSFDAPAKRNKRGVSSTASAAPPTYPTIALNICKTVPPEVAPGRNMQPIPVAKTETKPAATACCNGVGRDPGASGVIACAAAKCGHACSGAARSLKVSFASMHTRIQRRAPRLVRIRRTNQGRRRPDDESETLPTRWRFARRTATRPVRQLENRHGIPKRRTS
jgi:hypothetical protein